VVGLDRRSNCDKHSLVSLIRIVSQWLINHYTNPENILVGIREKWKGFRELPKDISQRVEELGRVFQRHEIQLSYLFGSLAERGQGDDVDIAVLGDLQDIESLRTALCEVLGTERLDLVDLRNASPTVQFEVISSGRLLFKISDEVENRFELRVLTAYQDREPVRRRQDEILAERTQEWSSKSG